LDRKLTLSAQWSAVAANNDVPAGYLPSTSYNLVNLYATYQPTKDVTVNLGIDNVFNEYYRPYAIPGSSSDGTSQNDALWTSAGPGVTYKAALKVHFGGV
ncbi:MAG: TonB-dependent receptor, partial [Pseudolabrys sp.]|nr:TonB-dependent receptor [Pseudolabrys sp.]